VPWKCVTAPRAEADDSILVLARIYGQNEKILIYSADKDMIQAQYKNPNVFQYSHQTKKWLEPEDKYDNMEHWFLEHQCLGDASDNIFHIMTKTEFSENFIKHLEDLGIKDTHPVPFRENKEQIDEKKSALSSFKKYKKPKVTDIGPVLDIYKDIRFGPSTLNKTIEKFGSLEKLLNSNKLIRENYELNYKLVMEEGIPEFIWTSVNNEFINASKKYNAEMFDKYLDDLGLFQCKMESHNIFATHNEELSIYNCGW
jgi:5'-3' exonuclease